jgi:hypothetical protein
MKSCLNCGRVFQDQEKTLYRELRERFNAATGWPELGMCEVTTATCPVCNIETKLVKAVDDEE